MAQLIEKISHIQASLKSELKQASTLENLEQVRIAFLGRNGSIADLMTELKALSVEEKRVAGPMLNELKQWAQQAYDEQKYALERDAARAEQRSNKYFDVTAYKYNQFQGRLHLYTKFVQKLQDIFISMGYEIVDGPEIETDYHNFKALNIPDEHPARDMHDTFWVDVPGMLLRTHTSNVQVREMEKRKPPFALASCGRVYRNEALDASHAFLFNQLELLFVDKDVSMSNLIATAKTFLQALFEKEIKVRVRPGYFPFVEPGVEIDASCPFCKHGCSICKKTGWIELLGAGLVHPNVLKCSGIDPDIYSGFALGTGLERIAMIKYGITDIRLFHSYKNEFLSQF